MQARLHASSLSLAVDADPLHRYCVFRPDFAGSNKPDVQFFGFEGIFALQIVNDMCDLKGLGYTVPVLARRLLDSESEIAPRDGRDAGSDRRPEEWPAPGSEDTGLGVLMGPEVRHGEAEVHARVQA